MTYILKQLIILGDSTVYGWGDPVGGGWCERLRKDWMNIKDYPVVYPLGIRGDGLEKVAKRWLQEWGCRGELRRKFPDAMILAIGLNDTAKIGRQDGRPQLSPDAFEFGLERLLEEIKAKSYVMVLGLTAVNEAKMPFAECLWYSNKACAKYERQIEETCLNLDIPFLPIHEAMRSESCWKDLLEADGIHLSPNGHIWMYEKIKSWKPLKQWLQR